MKDPKPSQYVIVQAKALKVLAGPLLDEAKKQTGALERIAIAVLEALFQLGEYVR